MIWHKKVEIKVVQKWLENTLMERMKFELTQIGDEEIFARFEVDPFLHQPMGILHGGINCYAAESIASLASGLTLDMSKQYSVGQNIHTTHLKPVRNGVVSLKTSPIQLGKKIQVWNVESFVGEFNFNLSNPSEGLLKSSSTTMTMMVITR